MALSSNKFNRSDAKSVKVRLALHVKVHIYARALSRENATSGGDLSHVCVGSATRLREGMDGAVALGPSAESHVDAVRSPVYIDTVRVPGFGFENGFLHAATGGDVQVSLCGFWGCVRCGRRERGAR